MNKILFPTEFSDHAPEVFRYALAVAQKFSAKLICLHAYGKPQHPMGSQLSEEERSAKVIKTLKTFAKKHTKKEFEEVPLEFEAIVGYPGESILDVAIDEGVQLIIMGMTGMTNSLETLFGSAATHVVSKADCPVLTIPAGRAYEPFKRMVYATNFEFRDLESINMLQFWAKSFKAKVRCMHVVEDGEDVLSARRSMNVLRHTYHGRSIIAFDLLEGNLHKNVKEYISDQKADLLVLLSHKRGFFSRIFEGSTALELAREVKVPLLVMKDNAYELPQPMNWSSVISIG